jgi:hypothetical protein
MLTCISNTVYSQNEQESIVAKLQWYLLDREVIDDKSVLTTKLSNVLNDIGKE